MKKNLIRLISVTACGALLAGCLAGCGGGEAQQGSTDETYELTWAGISTTESIDTWIGEEAARRISEQTDGPVQITVYPANQLGDLTVAYDEIMAGNIDMGLFTLYGTYDMIMESVYTPFLTANLDEFREVFAHDNFIYQAVDEACTEQGIKLFGFWPSGYLGIVFSELQETPEELFDFTIPKHELIRVPSMDSMMASAQAMGFNVTALNYSDVYTSLQTGIVDGSWHGGAYSNYNSFRDVISYYVDYRVTNDVYTLIMNQGSFDKLPTEYQEIVTNVLTEVIDEGTTMIGEQEAESLQALADYGVEVITPTDEQRAYMKDYFVQNVWPTFSEYYGEEFVNQMIEIAG